MDDAVIKVENLGKEYRIGVARDANPTLRDVIARGAAAPFRRLRHRGYSSGGRVERIWALRGINLEARVGETLGIIGRNGAGKSTLLKLLSRITEPTEGRIELRGRVGSLLEVGTGFHPELTGRENIFLNGAILGMRRAQVKANFDEIVEFSEIGKYIDTPVKRYSSGMYVRLAFAVAAYLEPEILVVDEVLAVGDYAFQKKCLGRMGDVAGQGRTVLFVSHNMGAISTLCSRAILLDHGELVAAGPTDDVVSAYINSGLDTSGQIAWDTPAEAPGGEALKLRAVRIMQRGAATSDVDIDDEVRVELEYWNCVEGTCASASIHLLDRAGVTVFATNNSPAASFADDGWSCRPHAVGLYRTACTIPADFLNEGLYKVSVFLVKDVTRLELQVGEAVSFTAHDTGVMRGEFIGPWIGSIRPRMHWETELVESSLAGVTDS
jgi:lipopolysaccharide transport system ATP-binding protein